VDLPASACTPAVLSRLKELFETHAGPSPVRVRFLSATGVKPLDVGTYRVDANGPLIAELRDLLGGEAARLEPELAGAPR
jgi:DNA polymerase-3 subunit alpha